MKLFAAVIALMLFFSPLYAQSNYKLLPLDLESQLPQGVPRTLGVGGDEFPTPFSDAKRITTGQSPLLEVTPFVLGGLQAPEHSYPWLVSLELANKPPAEAHFCGGSLIASKWVITAAHCFSKNTNPADLAILYGTNIRDKGGRRIKVIEVHISPEWDRRAFNNDLALVRIEGDGDVNFPSIRLEQTDEEPASGAMGYVAGWGKTRESGKYSNVLRHVQLQIISNAECNKPYAWGGFVKAQMFCAGFIDGGKDACRGDSGGPFMVPDRRGGFMLAGIVSWGEGCGTPGKYGVYTRVSVFRKWIQRIVGEH